MQFGQIQRRKFITLLGSATVTWPLAARAQPATPVIGFLSSLAHTDLGLVIPGFHEGLNGVGFVEGRNIAIEYRSGRKATTSTCRHWQTIWSSKRLP